MLKTQEVVDFACRTHFQDIPSETVNFAKMSVIDYCGVTLAGAKDPTSLLLSGYVKKIGSHPEASMIGQGFKSEASLAALVRFCPLPEPGTNWGSFNAHPIVLNRTA